MEEHTEVVIGNMYRTSEQGLTLLQQREGLRLKAYRCIAGVPTIGWGHTKGVKMGDTCSLEQAKRWLSEDVRQTEDYLNRVNDRIERKFLQHEFDALVSFIHQIGLTYFASSTCLKYIYAGKSPEEIASEFPRWCYVTKTVIDARTGQKKKIKVIDEGVRNRHLDEKRQYLRGY